MRIILSSAVVVAVWILAGQAQAAECPVGLGSDFANPSLNKPALGDSIQVRLGNSAYPRFREYRYQAPPGCRIAFVRFLENNGIPQGNFFGGPTTYYITDKTWNSFTLRVRVPCRDGTVTLSRILDVWKSTSSSDSSSERSVSDGEVTTKSSDNSWFGRCFGGDSRLSLDAQIAMVKEGESWNPSPQSQDRVRREIIYFPTP